MLKYSLNRLWQLIPTLLSVSLIVFFMVRLVPGDPMEVMYGLSEGSGVDSNYIEIQREKYGLNDPIMVQYFNFMKGFVTGDLGTSLVTHKPIGEELLNRYKYTIILAIGGTIAGSIIGVLFGVIAAVYHNKFGDNLVMVFSMIAVSTPSFFLAMIFMLIFSLKLGWLPSMGLTGWKNAILPILTLGSLAVGMIARTTRSSMLDVINQDYIRTAKTKGVSKWKVILVHAFKNALIPVLTAIGLRFGHLLAGAAIVETVFTIPGLGRFMIDAVSKRDYPVVQSTVLILSTSFVVVNSVVDLLYGLVDPRVKYD